MRLTSHLSLIIPSSYEMPMFADTPEFRTWVLGLCWGYPGRLVSHHRFKVSPEADCVVCQKAYARTAEHLIRQLPQEHLDPAPPFMYVCASPS